MAGKIFYRERRKVDDGEKKPRCTLVAVAGVDLKIHVKHLRKSELEQIAQAVGAELIELVVDEKGHKMSVGDCRRVADVPDRVTSRDHGREEVADAAHARARQQASAHQEQADGREPRERDASSIRSRSLRSGGCSRTSTSIKIGGQSICDRGTPWHCPPIVDEIVANKDEHKMLVMTGGGTRSRHIYAIGLELGMPTGIIAAFGSSVSRQNALLVATMLARHGGIEIDQDAIIKLPNYFAQGCIPVTQRRCRRTTSSPSRRRRGASRSIGPTSGRSSWPT